MKKAVFWITACVVLASINGLILKKESVLSHGQTILLELAPVDPRSLMQGDYMTLRYSLATEIPDEDLKDKGRIVVALDENNVARYVRIHRGESLSAGEHLLFYRNRKGLKLGAESFMFQEGLGQIYARARYGELKIEPSGESVLAGLRDKHFIPLDGGYRQAKGRTTQ